MEAIERSGIPRFLLCGEPKGRTLEKETADFGKLSKHAKQCAVGAASIFQASFLVTLEAH
ncbi:hypothetical protein PM8797T_23369 [Gimesia maris DSM 8797]|nr:hypothetical protein PM8797T_23369 [Gimesia maris DSM 8797]